MISFIITRIFWLCAYIVKNFGIIVGIIEQAIKLFVSIASMTPTRKDDELAQKVENFFDSWQGKIYSGAEAIVRFYNNIWTKIIK